MSDHFDEEPGGDPHGECALEINRLKAECERLRADAERYEWLRKQDWFDSTLCVLRDPKTVLTRGPQLGADCPSGTRLDAAIDAARAKP